MELNRPMNELQNIISKRLQNVFIPGEEIIWAGQPDPTVIFSRKDSFIVPYSLIFNGIMFHGISRFITHMLSIKLGPTDVFYNAVMIPALLVFTLMTTVALYLLFGRFIYKKWKKEHTIHIITNRRLLNFFDYKKGNLDGIALEDVEKVSKEVSSDGHGTIIFGDVKKRAMRYDNTGLDFANDLYYKPAFAFYDIKNVNQVYKIINELLYQRG